MGQVARAGCARGVWGVQGVWGAGRWVNERRADYRPAEVCGCCCSTSLGQTAPTGADWKHKYTKR